MLTKKEQLLFALMYRYHVARIFHSYSIKKLLNFHVYGRIKIYKAVEKFEKCGLIQVSTLKEHLQQKLNENIKSYEAVVKEKFPQNKIDEARDSQQRMDIDRKKLIIELTPAGWGFGAELWDMLYSFDKKQARRIEDRIEQYCKNKGINPVRYHRIDRRGYSEMPKSELEEYKSFIEYQIQIKKKSKRPPA